MLKRIITCVVVLLLLTGHSIVLNAQCPVPTTCTTQFRLNEVVICHKGACGDDGDFSLSRSASLFPTVTFQLSSVNNLFCIDPSDKFSIDFGDGGGFRLVNGSTSFTITYPTPLLGSLPASRSMP